MRKLISGLKISSRAGLISSIELLYSLLFSVNKIKITLANIFEENAARGYYN